MNEAGSFIAAADLPVIDRDRAADLGDAEGRAALSMLRSLRDQDWQRATDCTQWDVRALVSHLVGQCEDGMSLPTLLRRELTGRRHHPGLSGVDAHMAVQVADHLGDAGPELVDRFAAQWPRAVRARQRRPTPLRRIPIDLGIPGVPPAPLSYLLDVIYNRDLWMHRVDLAAATGQPFRVGVHDRHIVADAIRDLARRWSGPPVALELTGDAGGSWIIGAGRPTAVVRADAVAYLRALAGRDDAVTLTLVSGDQTTIPILRRARIPF